MKLGGLDISDVKIGDTQVDKVYQGDNLVWQYVPPTPLLDDYPNAAAAYSLRLLRSAYTGDAIRVRRASDSTEQDIGFVDNELDTSALSTFCSGTDGFVKTWYDQSGNGYDATQSTAANQPQIVNSGSVILENGKPTLLLDGVNDSLSTTGTPFSSTENTLIAISKQNAITNEYRRLMCIGNFLSGRQLGNNTNANAMVAIFRNFVLGPGGGIALNQNLSVMYNIAATGFFRQNSSQIFTKSANNNSYGNQNLFIGTDSEAATSNFWNGIGQEFIFYPTEQSTNITGIEDNINDYYSIY